MKRAELTEQLIANTTFPPGKRSFLMWDTKTTGLALRVTEKLKSFVFEAKGKLTITNTIGVWEEMSLDAARSEASRLQNLLDQGHDPRELWCTFEPDELDPDEWNWVPLQK